MLQTLTLNLPFKQTIPNKKRPPSNPLGETFQSSLFKPICENIPVLDKVVHARIDDEE